MKPVFGKSAVFAVLAAIALCVFFVSGAIGRAYAFTCSAECMIVLERDSGRVLNEKNADKRRPMASTTKIATVITVIENVEDLDKKVKVPACAVGVEGSSIYLEKDEELSVRDLLYGLMLQSGNDCAVALAVTVGGSVDKFAAMMNETAVKAGAENTHFVNPHGLHDDNHYTTARDLAKIAAYAMKNETFRQIDSSDNNVITVTGADGEQRDITMRRYNTILGQGGNIGGKTGSTYEALNCFAGVFSRDPGGEIYSIVLGCEEDEQRLAESMALADWYYNHTVDYPVVNTEQTTPDGEPLIARAPHADWTDKSVDVTTTDTGSTVVLFSLAGEVEQDVELQTIIGDVTEGQSVGTLTLSQDGKELASVELVSAENVEAPDPRSWILVQLDRVVRFVTGQPGTAELEVIADAPDALEVDAA